MRDIEIQFLDSFTKTRRVSSTDMKLLLSRPLGLATTEFLTSVQQQQIFEYNDAGKLWLQLEAYFKKSPGKQKKMLQSVDKILQKSLDGSNTGDLKTKKTGTYIMDVSPEIIRQVYLSNDHALIDLFERYVPTPPASFFEEKSVPEKIKLYEQEAKETIKKVALKTLEPFILKAQRHIRGKRRQREELHRIKKVHGRALNRRKMTAEELMQDANTPYVPKCESNLSKRIMDAAQNVSAFSTIKHITSHHTIQSVLDDALYGRRTLLDFYMAFNPAALMICDILNGDGNVVCLGPQDIDSRASGAIIIEFDLPKLLQTKPSAFYKQKDLEYSANNKIRHVLLGNTELYFDHTGFVRRADTGSAYLKIINGQRGGLTQIARSLKSTFIAYDLERMHEILTLNFFRFMDSMNNTAGAADQAYIDQFYHKVSQLDDAALVRFLTDIEKNLTDTAEFNFYGAHQINFSTVTSISDRYKGYTLHLPKFLHALNSGELSVLRQARQSLPEVFESYRFLDYLLAHVKNAEARYYLDDLRKQCKTPNWIQYTPLDITDELKIHWDLSDERSPQSHSVDSKKGDLLTDPTEVIVSTSIAEHHPISSIEHHQSNDISTGELPNSNEVDIGSSQPIDTSSILHEQDALEEESHSASKKRSLDVLKSGFDETLGKMQTELQTESDPVCAEDGKKLHKALSAIKEKFIQTGDSNEFIHNVKENVKKSEPTLNNSPVWKQFLLDILNAAILICTLGISYMVTGRLRLFTLQPQESEIDEAKTMSQKLQ